MVQVVRAAAYALSSAEVSRSVPGVEAPGSVPAAETTGSVPAWAHADRTIVAIRSSEELEAVIARFPGRVVFVGGGPLVWTAYAHLIRHWDVTRLPYDGPADRYFDPAWLIAHG